MRSRQTHEIMPLGNAWIGGRNWLLHAKILFVLAQYANALREKLPFAVVLTTASLINNVEGSDGSTRGRCLIKKDDQVDFAARWENSLKENSPKENSLRENSPKE